MKRSEYNISLDIHKRACQTELSCVCGDTARRICARFTEDGAPYRIDEGATALFAAKKADGTAIVADCAVADGCAVYDFSGQTAAVPGRVECELRLLSAEGEVITSPRFSIMVGAHVCDDREIAESSSEFSALTELVRSASALAAEVGTLAEESREATEAAQQASADAGMAADSAGSAAANANAAASDARQAAEGIENEQKATQGFVGFDRFVYSGYMPHTAGYLVPSAEAYFPGLCLGGTGYVLFDTEDEGYKGSFTLTVGADADSYKEYSGILPNELTAIEFGEELGDGFNITWKASVGSAATLCDITVYYPTKASVDTKIDKSAITQEIGDDPEKVPSQEIFTSMLFTRLPLDRVTQETGDSGELIMSQAAVTAALGAKLDKSEVTQGLGSSLTSVMSQNAVSNAIYSRVATWDILQTTGNSTTQIMSQAAVTAALDKIYAKISGLEAVISGLSAG